MLSFVPVGNLTPAVQFVVRRFTDEAIIDTLLCMYERESVCRSQMEVKQLQWTCVSGNSTAQLHDMRLRMFKGYFSSQKSYHT
jgi:hypothetical protein